MNIGKLEIRTNLKDLAELTGLSVATWQTKTKRNRKLAKVVNTDRVEHYEIGLNV